MLRAGCQVLGDNGATLHSSVDVSDIFYFFCSGEGKGEGKGERDAPRGGVRFLLKNARRRGGVSRERGEGGRGSGGCLRGIWGGGGGAKYFFSGRNSHQDSKLIQQSVSWFGALSSVWK